MNDAAAVRARILDALRLDLVGPSPDDPAHDESMARAAERECIVASAVSKRLATLESQLGVALIERSRLGLKPTPAGTASYTTTVGASRSRIVYSQFEDEASSSNRLPASSTIV